MSFKLCINKKNSSQSSKIESKNDNKNEQQPHMQISTNRDLLTEAANIGDLKRYNMMLQNISISSNVKNYLNNNRQK